MTWRAIAVLTSVWAAGVAFGTYQMLDYDLAPAQTCVVMSRWPEATSLVRDFDHPTLVLFLHPHCPCSRATLAELARMTAGSNRPFGLRIVFVNPPGVGEEWGQTNLYLAAEQIPGAIVSHDPDAVEAIRFGGTTSGEALLFASTGELLFHGGLTAARGHEGDNAGRAAVESFLTTGRAAHCRTPVFGCPLHDRPANLN